jgi:carbonic anhydrase/acetyltransferase-like protein (isoleucine patch superfamily)
MPIYRLRDDAPRIPESAYVSPEAVLIGKITLGENVSVYPGAVLRGDNEPIVIGTNSNVQDGAVLHVDPGFPMAIGANVTVGHQAMLHGCTIGDGSLIGTQAVILNDAKIGRHCLVAAAAVVLEGKVFPERSLIVGAPARVVRELTDDDVASLIRAADVYVKRGKLFKAELHRLD